MDHRTFALGVEQKLLGEAAPANAVPSLQCDPLLLFTLAILVVTASYVQEKLGSFLEKMLFCAESLCITRK